jgi:hypothetical protein
MPIKAGSSDWVFATQLCYPHRQPKSRATNFISTEDPVLVNLVAATGPAELASLSNLGRPDAHGTARATQSNACLLSWAELLLIPDLSS